MIRNKQIVFRKCISCHYLILSIIFIQISFKCYTYGHKILTHTDKLLYETEGASLQDVSNFIPYHSLEKRDVTVNTTNTSKNESMNDIDTNLPVVLDAGNNTVNDMPTANNTEYDPDSGDYADFRVEGYNSSGKFDHHRYYRSYSKSGMKDVIQYWVDLDTLPQHKVISHDSLSSAYRRALTVPLTFDFPFYGHTLRNVTIATGGFLFTGSFLHKWLAATQYIAPLMANFDTSVSPDASVKYTDNGTSLTVQWEKVVLQDNPTAGTFTFQVTIHQTGDIVFAYKDIPVVVTLIQDMDHPVKVGLSDAYIVEKNIFFVRKKTIYEYHKIEIKKGRQISNWTAIVFEPLPLCISFNTCKTCLTTEINFKCKWCPQVSRCSDGVDRHRQDWLEGRCDMAAVSNYSVCDQLASQTYLANTGKTNEPAEGASHDSLVNEDVKMGHSNVWVGLFMAMVVVVFFCGWVTYAYLHPHSASGQILIKYRPSAWSLRRGEARYTAATMHSIHM